MCVNMHVCVCAVCARVRVALTCLREKCECVSSWDPSATYTRLDSFGDASRCMGACATAMDRDDLPAKNTIAPQEAKAPPTPFFKRQTRPAHAKGQRRHGSRSTACCWVDGLKNFIHSYTITPVTMAQEAKKMVRGHGFEQKKQKRVHALFVGSTRCLVEAFRQQRTFTQPQRAASHRPWPAITSSLAACRRKSFFLFFASSPWKNKQG